MEVDEGNGFWGLGKCSSVTLARNIVFVVLSIWRGRNENATRTQKGGGGRRCIGLQLECESDESYGSVTTTESQGRIAGIVNVKYFVLGG